MVSYEDGYDKLFKDYYKIKQPNQTILDDKNFRDKYFKYHQAEIVKYLNENSYRCKGRPPLWLKAIKDTEKSLKVKRGNFSITFN